MTARTRLLAIAVALCAAPAGDLVAQDPAGAGRAGPQDKKDKQDSDEAEQRLQAYRSWVMELIREVFAEDYRNEAAGRTDPTFGRRLLALGRETQNDAIARAMLLAEAARVAAASGDAVTAVAVLDELGAGIADRQQALVRAAERLAKPADGARLVEQVLIVVEAAIASHEYGAAGELIRLGRRVAAGDDAMRELLATWSDKVRAEEALYATYRDSLAAVAGSKSGSPGDLSRAGEYLCLVQGRWRDGLWALACHEREEVEQVALADLADPKEPMAQLALADRWWALSEGEEEEGVRRDRMRERALVWYLTVEPSAGGLDRLKIEKRREEGEQIALARLRIAQQCADLGWRSLARRLLLELSEFAPGFCAPELERLEQLEQLEQLDRSGR